jgi:hypothetical protein
MIIPSENSTYYASKNSKAVGNPGGDVIKNASQENFWQGTYNSGDMYYDPLITGYAFFVWTRLPSWVTKTFPNFALLTQKNFAGFDGFSDLELNTSAFTAGFTTNELHVAQNMGAKPNSFNIKSAEFSGSPMNAMWQFWVAGIRDPETGVATYPKEFGMDYSLRNHTGELMYMVTRPDADNFERNIIEFAAYFTCVMPKRIEMNHWNFSKGSQEGPIEHEQSLNAIIHWGPKVNDVAARLMRSGGIGFTFMHENEWDPLARKVVKPSIK